VLRQIVNDQPETDWILDKSSDITKEDPFFWIVRNRTDTGFNGHGWQ